MGGPPAAEVWKEESKSREEEVEVAVREKCSTARRAVVEIAWSMFHGEVVRVPAPDRGTEDERWMVSLRFVEAGQAYAAKRNPQGSLQQAEISTGGVPF